MTFSIISKEEFENHCQEASMRSFMQSIEMAQLLQKRGVEVEFIAWKENKSIAISSILFSKPMTGGLHMEINCGPIVTDATHLSNFYQGLKDYARKMGALELILKPYDTYQHFDSNGLPIDQERIDLIHQLTSLNFQYDGLQTGYPGGEPDWLYVKDLVGLTSENLIKSFSKKGKPLIKKANTFGIQLKKLQRSELSIFKEITSSTSDRRDYNDKSLEYYQDFYDSFGDNAEFMVASLNFQDYYEHLKRDQEVLNKKIQNLQSDLQNQSNSEKKQNQLKELMSQFDSFEVRKKEAREFIQTYGEQDVVLAGSLFIYTPQETTYLFSGSYTEFNKFYAPALLQEYVMRQSLKKGIPTYNFLGIQGVFDGSDGVLRFKQNFNGFIVRKMGTFRYYPHPWKYKCIQLLKRILRRQ